ncbi:MAG TPA: hypothetical protein VH062_02355 [Polyangiaceae bacterium]|jgi:hypothetical protein|nr:hypothetical protein [Polyangiaceae bacterium]
MGDRRTGRAHARREPKPSAFDLAVNAALVRRSELAESVALAYPEYDRVAVEFGALGKATFNHEAGSVFGYAVRMYRAELTEPVIEVWVPVEASDAAVTAELEAAFAKLGGA